ncbi:hypothetical protein [Candidatus Uabimicrobium amorphum]|uniref:Lipoprotein n=1 Tax=Uabimicrobium amorphum TaxID=2596890 RepID=A0A5S9IMU7_UABAM|nr:hypothetical protein [Candidatus Uabimicrobium amorphum]BBM84808.1 hypothetical protein UABAM_03169 [Candidatus Uabimicrobium amorphum]
MRRIWIVLLLSTMLISCKALYEQQWKEDFANYYADFPSEEQLPEQ